MEYRIEHDTMGEVKVPSDKLWGAQTQRSSMNFKVGKLMPIEIIRAFAYLKNAAACANMDLGRLAPEKASYIMIVCDQILNGELDENFPLVVYQTGSGTQTNMNVNEVIAGRAKEMAGVAVLHPNDDVNMSQSSNDTFPTAMSIASVFVLEDRVLPALNTMIVTLKSLEAKYMKVIKTGRTHLQDAVPMTFGQEISGWRSMLEHDYDNILKSLDGLREIALGGTAVGTGLNAPDGFAERAAEALTSLTKKEFITAPNKFHSLSSKDAYVFAHGALKALAADLMKMANDIRWLSSGPRCGLGEIFIPENEPGSSIMPGKVNPTQCESMTMVCVQVMANNVAVNMASSQGNFELNVFMPVLIHNFLQSVRLLSDGMDSFRVHCVCGIKANRQKMHENLHNSLMLVTAISPYIGYESAAKVAKLAHKENISLKEATLKLDLMTEEEFDKVFKPEEMV